MNQLDEIAIKLGAAAKKIAELHDNGDGPAANEYWEEVAEDYLVNFVVVKAAAKEILNQHKAASKVKQESTTSSGAKRGRR